MRKSLIGILIALAIATVVVVSVLTHKTDAPIKSRNAAALATESTVWASTTLPAAIPSTTTTVAPRIAEPVVMERQATKPVSHKQTTTTTAFKPEAQGMSEDFPTPLQVAQLEVGKRGTYAEGGFWCAKFVSWTAQQAKVPGWKSETSPAKLRGNAQRDGRIHSVPAIGDMVFIDLAGENGLTDYASHVEIVESIEGKELHTIGGNVNDSDVVTRVTRTIGDGFIMDFASFTS